MENFGVKKIHQKNKGVEKHQMRRQKNKNKKQFSDDKNNWITGNFETIKMMYGCYYCRYCDFGTKI